MTANKIKVVLIRTTDDLCSLTYETVELTAAPDYASQVREMREYLECDTLEHHSLKIGGELFGLWLDDMGKLLNPPKYPAVPLLYKGSMYDVVVGNVIVSKSTPDGDTVGLTEEEVQKFLDYLRYAWKQATDAVELKLTSK